MQQDIDSTNYVWYGGQCRLTNSVRAASTVYIDCTGRRNVPIPQQKLFDTASQFIVEYVMTSGRVLGVWLGRRRPVYRGQSYVRVSRKAPLRQPCSFGAALFVYIVD